MKLHPFRAEGAVGVEVRRPRGPSTPPSIICADMVVIGDVTSTGDIHIDGRVEGVVRGAHVTIGQNGAIEGEVRGERVTIHGHVQGLIRARTAWLDAACRVEGEVVYEFLTVELGARLDAICRQTGDPFAAALPIAQSTQPKGVADVSVLSPATRPKSIRAYRNRKSAAAIKLGGIDLSRLDS